MSCSSVENGFQIKKGWFSEISYRSIWDHRKVSLSRPKNGATIILRHILTDYNMFHVIFIKFSIFIYKKNFSCHLGNISSFSNKCAQKSNLRKIQFFLPKLKKGTLQNTFFILLYLLRMKNRCTPHGSYIKNTRKKYFCFCIFKTQYRIVDTFLFVHKISK